MMDNNNQIIASMASMWTLMHTQDRKMMKIPDAYHAMIHQSSHRMAAPNFSFKFANLPGAPEYRNVNYLHLDWNGHVNNVQLIKMIFECLPEAFIMGHNLDFLQVQFKHEALLGMQLQLHSHLVDSCTMHHVIKDAASNSVVLMAQSEWTKK